MSHHVSDAAIELITTFYARYGRMPETARRIYIDASPHPAFKCSASPPGSYPTSLLERCNAARAAYLKSRNAA